jgi:two-component system response regulator YesN
LLRVQDVARAVGLSKSHLAQAFKRETDETVRQYIQTRRMAKAAALLYDLSLSIKEIAALVGIPDSGNFARAFQKATGCTPTEFRNRLRR